MPSDTEAGSGPMWIDPEPTVTLGQDGAEPRGMLVEVDDAQPHGLTDRSSCATHQARHAGCVNEHTERLD